MWIIFRPVLARRLTVACLAVLAASVASGCAARSAEHPGIPLSGSPRVLADGRLATNPAPLTLQDVERLPAGSPGRAVMMMLFWAQWGSPPNVAAAYDSGVMRALGVSSLVGTWESVRQSIVRVLPKIAVERFDSTRREAFVGLELANTAGPPIRQAFDLRRVGAVWQIVYDTMLDNALPGYVAEQLTPDPAAKHVSAAGERAGIMAAARYRAYWAGRIPSGQGSCGSNTAPSRRLTCAY